MNPEAAQGLMNALPFLLSGPALLYVGKRLRMVADKYKKAEEKVIARRAERLWRTNYLPMIAKNIAIRQSTVDDFVGVEFDASRIGYAFNPYGKTVSNYIRTHPAERRNLREKLTQLVSEAKAELNN